MFVDYDATITDVDTFDVLVRHCAGPEEWARLEEQLHGGGMTLREVLAVQARFVTLSLDDADAYLAQKTRFDPSFKAFVETAEAQGASVTILSSGVEPLIERALARNGVSHVRALANGIRIADGGWEMLFRDGSDNGHDKRADVTAASQAGHATVYIGDGFSDFDAAVAADRRFAKRGRALERYLRERNIPFVPFTHFNEVEAALFSAKATASSAISEDAAK